MEQNPELQASFVMQAAPSASWAEFDVGKVTISATGNQFFKFTVVGKNAASSGYTMTFDYIKLIPQ